MKIYPSFLEVRQRRTPLPSANQNRRLTDRILANWASITEEKHLPRPAEITPDVFGDDWPLCALIKVDSELGQSQFIHLGDEIPSPQNAAKPKIVKEFAEDTLLRRAAAKIPAVISKLGPITFGGACGIGDDIRLYRSILLPVSEDNKAVDHVLVAISYRDVPLEDGLLDRPTGLDLTDTANLVRALMGHRLFPLM
jgi:hypothetical protein